MERKGVVMEKEKWLKCIISPGQFTGEFAVQGKMFDSTDFSLFAPEEDLQFNKKKPTGDEHVKGAIRVIPLAEEKDLMFVALPRPTFENGQTITVKINQIK